jgi:SAM-dependent methyltransferase
VRGLPLARPGEGPGIIVVSAVEDYRRLARGRVGPKDSVLEIGCSTGMTTERLARSARSVVAVDHSPEMVALAKARCAGLGNVRVLRADARDAEALRALCPEPDALFLDIGGDAFLDRLALVLRACLGAFPARLFVVRNFELAGLALLIREAHAFAPPRSMGEGELLKLLELSRGACEADRLFALRRLRRLDDPRARERIDQMAEDPSPRVRKAARSVK